MKKSILLSVVLGIAIYAVLIHAVAEPVSVLFEKGIYLEETKGDLNGAMEIYKKILEESETNRAYAAQAQYRLGMCYMKKGEKEKSIEIFKDLVEKYPEQKDLVEKAMKHIPEEPKTEEEWAKIRDEAIGKGDLAAACDAEMGRVLIRKKEGHAYKDKISLDSIYLDLPDKNKLSMEQKKAKLNEILKYLQQHKGNEEYEWRICHLLSVMCADMGDKEKAGQYMDQCLETYPFVDYGDPSKFSKFHHLVNQRAGMIWDEEGAEAAENFFLDKLENDKRCEYFFQSWWNEEYNRRKQTQRLEPFLEKVKNAYQARMKKNPEKEWYCYRYLKEMGVDTGDKGKSKEEVLSETKDEAMAKGNLIAACDAEMQRVLHRKEDGNVWKDKIDLKYTYENYARDKNPAREWKEEKLKELEVYLAKHKGDVEYEWRIQDLLSAINNDLGNTEEAKKCLEKALPSKHSKYHHMVNEMSGLIWDMEGMEKAEAYFLGKLEQDKKCEYFYSGWWREKYEKTGMKDRYLPMLNEVEKAYQTRIANFPEKKSQIEQYIQWLNEEKKR
jgi:tetratricopeptide (TPR) repeat protein